MTETLKEMKRELLMRDELNCYERAEIARQLAEAERAAYIAESLKALFKRIGGLFRGNKKTAASVATA